MKKNAVKSLCLIFAFTLMAAYSSTANGGIGKHKAFQSEKPVKAVIEIYNPGKLAREQEVFEVSAKALSEQWQQIIRSDFKLVNAASGEEIPYQWEYKGAKTPQNLLIQASIDAGATLKIQVINEKPIKIEPKTFARFVPERKDDFAWENDRIAFRMYGPALEGTNQDAHGIDVWTKRTRGLVIDKWYKNDDYHSDNGEGMDYYKVGMSLGAGDIAPFINNTIYYSKNYEDYKVLDNGPLRSTFRLIYHSWKAGDVTLNASKTISLDANSQLNRVEVLYELTNAKTLPAVVGIVLRPDEGNILLDEQNGIMGYWEPVHGQDGITGVGVIVRGNENEMLNEQGHLLSKVNAENKQPLVYYNGAAWNKAGRITSADEWFRYLSGFDYKLEHPVVIKVK